MALRAQGETADQLIDAARRGGFVRTRTQLARRHRAGLLPTPEQMQLGRGKGSVSVYPAGSGAQFVALCEIEQRVKDLGPAGFELWWRGYEVDPSIVSDYLRRAALVWDRALEGLRGLARTERGQARLDDLVEASGSARLGEPVMRRARKRLGRGRFPTLVRVLLDVSGGTFYDYERDSVTGDRMEEQSIVERGLGIDAGRTGSLPGTEAWLDGPSGTALAEVSALMAEHQLSAALAACSMSDLAEARDELGPLLTMFEELGLALGRQFSGGALGFGVVASALESMQTEDRAQFLLFWLVLRRYGPPAFQTGAAALMPEAHLWDEAGGRAIRALEAMEAEIPELAEMVSPRRMLMAQSSAQRHAAWQASLAEVRERHASELEEFFLRHPEYVIE